MCEQILAQPESATYFRDYLSLYDCLDYYYGVVLGKLKISRQYTMKTIRCRFATDWVMEKTEC